MAKLWGYHEIWLHVDHESREAYELYKKIGYKEVLGVAFWRHSKRRLMKKSIVVDNRKERGELKEGGMNAENGAYIWNV